MNVVYISDEKYVMPTCVSLVSLCFNEKETEELNVYILCHGVCTLSKDKLKRLSYPNLNLRLIDVKKTELDEISRQGHILPNFHVTKTALFKFFLYELLPHLDKVLYLDCDTVINKDISELWSTDVTGYYGAVVERPYFPKSNIQNLGLKDGYYFNSGVMLMNLDLMRKEKLADELVRYRQNGLNSLMDQDSFNVIMHDRLLKMDYRYNFGMLWYMHKPFHMVNEEVFGSIYKSERECIEGQSIVHFSGRYKPWKYVIPYFSEIFHKYYLLSPYKHEDLEMCSLLDVLTEREFESERGRYFDKLMEDKLIDWRLPIEKIPEKSRIIVYGAGACGKSMVDQIKAFGCYTIMSWVGKNYNDIDGVQNPECIAQFKYDYILIAVSKLNMVDEIEEYLKSNGVSEEKIIRLL